MLDITDQKYSSRIDGDRWIILTSLGDQRWQVQLWGAETMQVEFVCRTERDAKQHALSLVSLFLVGRDPQTALPTKIQWRPVLSVTRRRWRFHSL